MADGYLGEFPMLISETPFKDFMPADWVMEFVSRYGQIDGAHHKAWVLDQVARILLLTPIIVVEARWEHNPPELRFWTGQASAAYIAWVNEMKGPTDEDGETEYDYDMGVAP